VSRAAANSASRRATIDLGAERSDLTIQLRALIAPAIHQDADGHPAGARLLAAPGIATPIFVGGADAPREHLPLAMEGVRAVLARAQPIPRCGEPGDVAQAAVFLASDESTFVTGQALGVDGGLLAGAGGRAMAEALRGGVADGDGNAGGASPAPSKAPGS